MDGELEVPDPDPGLGGNLPHVDGRGLLPGAAAAAGSDQHHLRPQLHLHPLPAHHHQAAHAPRHCPGQLSTIILQQLTM